MLSVPGLYANIGGVWWKPGIVSKPINVRKTGIVVRKEILTLNCSEKVEGIRCSFRAEYNLLNPGKRSESALCAYYGILNRDIQISIDNKPVSRKLSKQEVLLLDKAVADIRKENRIFPLKKTTDTRKGFLLRLAPSEKKKVVVTGHIDDAGNTPWGFAATYGKPLQFRHSILSSPSSYFSHDIVYFLSPIKTWRRVDEIIVRINHDNSYTSEAFFINRFGHRGNIPRPGKQVGLISSERKNSVEKEWRGKGIPGNFLIVRFKENRSHYRFNSGGFSLRSGADFEDPVRFRAGMLYEFSFPHRIIYSFTAETDFRSHLTFAPLLEISTYAYLFTSCSFGIGAPYMIRFDDSNAPGVRFQPAVHFGPLGIILPIDYYPGLKSDDPERFQLSLFLQVSF
jgi:hypothetical protein